MVKKKYEIEKPAEVKGHAMFENGKLIFPKKKSAEELLKETPLPSKLAREIAEIESRGMPNKRQKTKKDNAVNSESMMTEICKCNSITTYVSAGQNVVQFNKKTICWISDRKYGIAVSVWGAGGKDFKTLRIVSDKEMKDMIEKIKRGVAN